MRRSTGEPLLGVAFHHRQNFFAVRDRLVGEFRVVFPVWGRSLRLPQALNEFLELLIQRVGMRCYSMVVLPAMYRDGPSWIRERKTHFKIRAISSLYCWRATAFCRRFKPQCMCLER